MTASMTASMESMEESAAKVTGWLLGLWRREAGYRRQADLGRALGISERSVQAMESGSRPRTDDAEIVQLQQVLRLNDEQRELLWALTHCPPPMPTSRPGHEEEVLRDIVNWHPWPAIMMDEHWDLQAANRIALSLWPWLKDPRHRNMLLRCLTDPDARLANWEDEYAGPLIEQLRLASLRAPRDQRLAELREAVLDGGPSHTRAVLRRKWDQPDGRRLSLPPEVHVHLPAVSQTPVVLRQTPLTTGHPGLRVWLMEPITEQDDS